MVGGDALPELDGAVVPVFECERCEYDLPMSDGGPPLKQIILFAVLPDGRIIDPSRPDEPPGWAASTN